jgi:hypothetical protein
MQENKEKEATRLDGAAGLSSCRKRHFSKWAEQITNSECL